MKIAIIGQSQFGLEVYKNLRVKGHEIVGVFTIPDVKGKPDVLASGAEEDGVKVFKFPRWRVKGEPIPEVVDTYKACGADLNVLPFCSQFIPMNVIDFPKHGSIIYHPSLLPRHRGASAINWYVHRFLLSAFCFSNLAKSGNNCPETMMGSQCWHNGFA